MRLRLRSLAALLALVFAAPATAQPELDVTFRFVPDTAPQAVQPVAQAFVPGSFNDWGQPYVNDNRIQAGDESQMTRDDATGVFTLTQPLTVGETYFYKVQAHGDTDPNSDAFRWITDPLLPPGECTFGGFGDDCRVVVADPMAFQLALEEGDADRVTHVSAGIFASAAVAEITFSVNDETFTNGLDFYDAATGVFRYELASPVDAPARFALTARDADGNEVQAAAGVEPPDVIDAPVPAGLEDGIHLDPSDPTRMTVVLRAPGKRFVHLLGDFNGFEAQDEFVLRRDAAAPLGTRWWIEVTGLTPGEPVRFQYLVDGALRISDPYAPLVLNEGDDPFVPNATFPGLPAYPDGASGQVTVVTPGAEPFDWQHDGAARPPLEELVIYEMLVRDWVARHDFQTVRDSLDYLERLGVNALQLMPVSEFDGNLSWGYNPNHYFAVDKYYGPPDSLRALIDEAHRRGMAVILDVVYNHQTGQAPFVQLYNDGAFGPPTGDNPWVNRTARHPFNVFNDNDHEAELTQQWLDRANRWWIEEYHVDGFRYDLSKGFTQRNTLGDVGAWSAYDQSRIDLLTRMADAVWAVDPDALLILEHFADPSEERVLANHGRDAGFPGMALWQNLNRNYSQAAMGYLSDGGLSSDLRGAYPPNNGYPLHGQVAYMESHDEQWMMYRTRSFGPRQGDYNVRELPTALDRHALAAAFFLTVPGPKMIWQFGELGYGFGDTGEQCLRGTGETCPTAAPGRTDAKPIRWDYFEDPDRRDLYRAYADLLALRAEHDAFRAPESFEMRAGQGQADRWIKASAGGLTFVVVGNFGLTARTQTPPLDAGQTWFSVLDDGEVAGGDAVALAPGEYRVYANQDIGLPTSSETGGPRGVALGLGRPFPNPAAGAVAVPFALDAPGRVTVEAFDALGRRVAVVLDEERPAGEGEAVWDARGLPAGVYALRLRAADGRTAVARVTLTR